MPSLPRPSDRFVSVGASELTVKTRFWLFSLVVLGGLTALSTSYSQDKDKVKPPTLTKPDETGTKTPDKGEKPPEKAPEKAPDKAQIEVKNQGEEKKDEKADEKKDEKSPLEKAAESADAAGKKAALGVEKADTAWMLVSTAFVMLMVPGLALFYGGMVRRKNVLATMMQSMICLSVVGVFWVAIGYSLAFGDPWIRIPGPIPGTEVGWLGFSKDLVFLQGIRPDMNVPGLTIPVYLHMAYQGMFAIITPALISGALAERIKFKSYLLFVLIWMVVIYCPLAQSVWAMNWNWGLTVPEFNTAKTVDSLTAATDDAEKKLPDAKDSEKAALNKTIEEANKDIKTAQDNLAATKKKYLDEKMASLPKDSKEEKENREKWYGDWTGTKMSGYLGSIDALDFAGGTVVHISAGLSSLAAFLALRKRFGYPEHAFHPNSMVLTLTGAGILWFGWFGFNGGSGLLSGTLATSAFVATQAAAAGAGLSWTLVEWLHRGKPTALGFASGVVAGLVAVTPAAGYVLPYAGLVIGLIAGVVCYCSVFMKSIFKYDDSLDAFGVHGVGGFFGAVITGIFCWKPVNSVIVNEGLAYGGGTTQLFIQLKAAVIAVVLSFVVSFILVKLIDLVMGFTVSQDEETTGLDRVEHGESGFDLGLALETASAPISMEPRSAVKPADGVRYYTLAIEGASSDEVAKAWSELCQPGPAVSPEFKAIYSNFTTVQGSNFRFRGGDPNVTRDKLQALLSGRLKKGITVKVA